MSVTLCFLILFFCWSGFSLHLILQPSACNAMLYSPSTVTGHQVEVDMVYMRLFPWHRAYKYKKIKDCSSVYIHEKNRWALKCLEHIHLLRPEKTVQQWQYEQLHNGSVKLKPAVSRIGQVQAKVIRTTTSKNIKSTSSNAVAGKVTGIFISHGVDVRQYKFKNITTGHISTINATRNHQFYVKNKKTFIPLAKILSGDLLVTETGEIIRLVCTGKRQTHCGLPYNKTGITSVYNIEIDKKHTYLVGEQHILVHNTCLRGIRKFFSRCRRNNGRLTLSDTGAGNETGVISRESRWKRFKSRFEKAADKRNKSSALRENEYNGGFFSTLPESISQSLFVQANEKNCIGLNGSVSSMDSIALSEFNVQLRTSFLSGHVPSFTSPAHVRASGYTSPAGLNPADSIAFEEGNAVAAGVGVANINEDRMPILSGMTSSDS